MKKFSDSYGSRIYGGSLHINRTYTGFSAALTKVRKHGKDLLKLYKQLSAMNQTPEVVHHQKPDQRITLSGTEDALFEVDRNRTYDRLR